MLLFESWLIILNRISKNNKQMSEAQPEEGRLRPHHRLRPIQLRTYNSFKHIRHNYLDSHSASPKNVPELHRLHDPLSTPHPHPNQTMRFKPSNPKERLQMIRKNRSLKQLRSQEGLGSLKSIQEGERRGGEVVQSLNSIPGRRLVKKGQNKLRIERREKAQQGEKSEVSFEECLEKPPHEERLALPAKISSENLLGSGRKNSWVKMKALVINPFERLVRQQQHLQQQQSHLSSLIEQQLKESQILSPPQEASVSVTQTQEIEELLNML